MYTLNLKLHSENLTLISARSYATAINAARAEIESHEALRAEWRADVAAEVVASFYFYDSYTGAKRI